MRKLFICLFLACSMSVSAQIVTPQEKAVLDIYYAQAVSNKIDGAWIIDGTITKEKLSPELQQEINDLNYRTNGFVSLTANYTVATNDVVIKVDTSSGSNTSTLPLIASVQIGKWYQYKHAAGTLPHTIKTSGADTVLSGDPLTLYQYESMKFWTDGSKWYLQ